MKFVDEAIITVKSGDGGRGCTSFRRERYIEKGGPDGGDGGHGGHIILKIDQSKRTLYDYRRQKLLKAKNGAPGLGKQKHGKNGSDCTIILPPGTIVSNMDTNEIIADLTKIEDEFGDILFSLVNYARFNGIDPESALEKTNLKFKSRFEYIEKKAPRKIYRRP